MFVNSFKKGKFLKCAKHQLHPLAQYIQEAERRQPRDFAPIGYRFHLRGFNQSFQSFDPELTVPSLEFISSVTMEIILALT